VNREGRLFDSVQAHHSFQSVSGFPVFIFRRLCPILCHTRVKNGLCDGFQSGPLRRHADVRVVFKHPPAEVPSDGHQDLFTGLPFAERCDAGVPEVMEADIQPGVFQGAPPCRPPRLDRPPGATR
jgi:hypothetical protein